MTMDDLLSQRSAKLIEQDTLVKRFRTIKSVAGKKDLNKLRNRYGIVREEIIDIEDKIANISEDKLEEIVEPNPLEIEDAVDLFDKGNSFTRSEWEDAMRRG